MISSHKVHPSLNTNGTGWKINFKPEVWIKARGGHLKVSYWLYKNAGYFLHVRNKILSIPALALAHELVIVSCSGQITGFVVNMGQTEERVHECREGRDFSTWRWGPEARDNGVAMSPALRAKRLQGSQGDFLTYVAIAGRFHQMHFKRYQDLS